MIDKRWRTAPERDILIIGVLNNETASKLRNFQSISPNHVEIFLTNKYGANVAATNRTSDYYQADEDWWKVAYSLGKGKVYIGQPEFDESSQTYSINLAIPIFYKGKVAGVLRSTYDVSALVANFQQGTIDAATEIDLRIQNDTLLSGEILTQDELPALSEAMGNSMTFRALRDRPQRYAAVRLWGTVGYIVAAVGVGAVMDRIGLRAGMYGVAVAMLACCGVAWAGTSRERLRLPPVGVREILESLRNRRLLILVTATGLAWVSYGPYGTFYTFHLERLGYSRAFAGLAWALAPGSELVVMLLWPRMCRRAAASTWLIVALSAHPLRWLLSSIAYDPALLLAIQLHARQNWVKRTLALLWPANSNPASGVQ